MAKEVSDDTVEVLLEQRARANYKQRCLHISIHSIMRKLCWSAHRCYPEITPPHFGRSSPSAAPQFVSFLPAIQTFSLASPSLPFSGPGHLLCVP